MKILWFTNTPAIASKKLKSIITVGGWLYALGNELKKVESISLAIAFYYKQDISPFEEEGVKFYPLYHGKSKSILVRLKEKFASNDEGRHDIDKFNAIIKDFQPDLIHIHGTELPFIRILESNRIPTVISIQGNITVYKHFYYRGIDSSSLPKYIFNNFKIKLSPFYRDYKSFEKKSMREKELFGKFKYIIGRTEWDRNIFRIFAPQAKYFHNDEILREEFYRYKWKSKVEKTLTLYTTTTDLLYKGFETIIQTAILLRDGRYPDFIWKIGGLSTDANIVKLLKSKYKKNYPENHLKLLGRLTAPAIIREMMNADMYILPSHIENSPNSLCEAMILGMPCIATHAGGTNSLLQNGREGILIQDGDPWSMAGSVIELFENKDLCIKLGENARKRALLRHNPNTIKNDLLKIYSSILSIS